MSDADKAQNQAPLAARAARAFSGEDEATLAEFHRRAFDRTVTDGPPTSAMPTSDPLPRIVHLNPTDDAGGALRSQSYGTHYTQTATDVIACWIGVDGYPGLAKVEHVVLSLADDATPACAYATAHLLGDHRFLIRTWTSECKPATAHGKRIAWIAFGSPPQR
jgi:hypothetical protein